MKISLKTIEGHLGIDFRSMIDILIAVQRGRRGARFLNEHNSANRTNRDAIKDKTISSFPHCPPGSESHRD